MGRLQFLDLIPAENPAHLHRGVNLLLMVDNRGEDITTVVRFFGSDGSGWREIYAQEQAFRGQSHIHAYFHLPKTCFAPENWGGEELEELAIWAGETAPAPAEQGCLLFFEP